MQATNGSKSPRQTSNGKTMAGCPLSRYQESTLQISPPSISATVAEK